MPGIEEISVEDLMSDSALLDAWAALAHEDERASYFQTSDWLVSWWETIGGRPGGVAGTAWDGSKLVGLLPLVRVKEPISKRLRAQASILTNAGSGIGTDHAGWLAVGAAGEQLARWTVGLGALVLRGIPLAVGETLGARLLSTERCPRLEISQRSERMSSKLAKNLRNARRRLDREGFEFSWVAPGQVTNSNLEDLYELNRMRRSEVGDSPVFDDPARRVFHERLLAHGSDGRGTALMVATQGGTPRGILYGFVWKKTFSYYQIGWDPEFHKLSLGSVLVMEAIEECDRRGIEVFDFLRGADEYKYRFGAEDVVEGSFALGRSTALTLLELAQRLRAMRRR